MSLLSVFSIFNSKSSQAEPGGLALSEIKSLKVAINDPVMDHFKGDDEEINKILDALAKDSSKIDSAYLYFAANTAFLHQRLEDAAFFFYAAQIRKRLDYFRYGLGQPNGNNIETYLTYLNNQGGRAINPAIIREPEKFIRVIDRLESWQPLPAEDAYYDKASYGKYAASKSQHASQAAAFKEKFMTDYGRKTKALLGDPKYVEAMLFIQDFNFGKIAQDEANKAKYGQAKEVMDNLTAQYDQDHAAAR